MPVPFFVIIRLGIGVHNNAWFDSVLGLFEAITFSSLCAQSCPDFSALVVVDRGIPAGARSRLSEIIDRHDNFHVVSVDQTAIPSFRQGGFDYVWDACQQYLLAKGVITNPFDYVITSILDAGDAWHRSTVAVVRGQVEAELPEFLASELQSLADRHSSGLYLSFPNGLEWYVQSDIRLPIREPYHSASTFVAARLSSGISACSCRHGAWSSYCGVLGFKAIVPEASKPMWAWVRHDRAEASWTVPDKSSDPEVARSLHEGFGIDFDRIATWINNYIPPEGVDRNLRVHKGMPQTEQLDCGLRISALKRQIAALERRRKVGKLDSVSEELLIEQCRIKVQLERLYQERAQSGFR